MRLFLRQWTPVLGAGFATWMALLFLVFPSPLGIIATKWIITPIAVFGALFANATAVGGGFLFIPVFIFGFGLTSSMALKLSLATQAFGMTAGTLGWSKEFIVTKALLVAAASSFVGMYVGTFQLALSNQAIKEVFGWASILIGAAIVVEIQFGTFSYQRALINDTVLKASVFVILCFLGGVITAWISIGIGEVVALYLLFVYRIRIESAISTGVAALALASILGFSFHAYLGDIPWGYLAFTAPGVLVGGIIGGRLGRSLEARMYDASQGLFAVRKGTRSPLKWMLATIMVLDGGVMLLQVYLVR